MEFDVKTATEILTNPKHEHYEASRRPGEVYNAVMRAFETAHPGEQTLGDGNNLPVHLDQAMNAEATKLGLVTPTQPVPPEATQPQTQPETAVTQPTEQAVQSPLWDTPEAEALTSYKAVYGENYQQAAEADVRAVVEGFIEEYVSKQGTPQAKAHVVEYLDQFMRRMGNHPLNALFLRYVGHRLSYFSK
jgi:hypothetical protein